VGPLIAAIVGGAGNYCLRIDARDYERNVKLR